jgi:hypothetical protein
VGLSCGEGGRSRRIINGTNAHISPAIGDEISRHKTHATFIGNITIFIEIGESVGPLDKSQVLSDNPAELFD